MLGEFRDPREAETAPSELLRHAGVADVVGCVHPIAGGAVTPRPDDSGAFPRAQGGRHDAEQMRHVADEQRGARVVGGIVQVVERGTHSPEGGAILGQFLVGSIEQREGPVEIVAVDGAQNLPGARVPASGDQREEGVEGQAVDRGVDPVARRGAPRRWQDALLLVVPHRLG